MKQEGEVKLKVCQFSQGENLALGIVTDDETIIDAKRFYEARIGKDYAFPTRMMQLIEDGAKGREAVERLYAEIDAKGVPQEFVVAKSDMHLRAPLSRPGKFFSLAINQGESWRRATKPDNPVPLYFIKVNSAITGPYDPIIIPDIGKVGCEVELAIVLGKGGKNIPVETALDHVFGYTIHNDITAHELRKRGEWIQSNRKDGSSERLTYAGRYKNFDSFAPMGPWITLASKDFDPHNLNMQAHLNDDLIQKGNTGDYIYKFAEVIAYLSEAHTLEPGDIISSGTCPYVDPWTMAKANLEHGVLRSRIEGIGEIANPIQRTGEGSKVAFSYLADNRVAGE